MKIVIPCLYSSYGRYITRFRAFPYNIDCLKLVERRVLLGLYDVARKSMVKSAKVVGQVIANYHPHGDITTYGTLQQLVHRGFAKGKGNWGTRGMEEDDPAAAMRYTECQLNKQIENFAFKYINYVPWENIEYENEPLALPAPIPLGLIGSGVTWGLAFHRSLIPRYKLSDLAKRLTWLLENGIVNDDTYQLTDDEITESKLGPCIAPHVDDCSVKENGKNQFYHLLVDGHGSIQYIPNGKIRGNDILILGRAPNHKLRSLINACEDQKKKDKKTGKISIVKKDLDVRLVDSSGKTLEVTVTPSRKTDLNELVKTIWSKYLIQNLRFNNLVCNNSDTVESLGIDDLLLNNFDYWRNAVFTKRLDDCNKQFKRKFQNSVIKIIRDINSRYNCTKVDDIVNVYLGERQKDASGNVIYETAKLEKYDNNKHTWINSLENITEDDIRDVCINKSIRQLIEVKLDMSKIDQDIQDVKQTVGALNIDCYNEVKGLI